MADSTFKEIERLAEDLIDRKTRNFVTDAMVLARWILTEGKRLAALEPSMRPQPSHPAHRVEFLSASRQCACGLWPEHEPDCPYA